MKNRLFTGSGVAIVTPFNEDGVDFEAFGRLIEYQVEHGTDAIIVCGTTGESATMPDYEHISVVEYCVKKVNCSACDKEITYNEIAGRYFAGIYCKECWENKYKEIEAKETYE